RPGSTGYIWRNAIVDALNAPLRLFVWVVGLTVIELRMDHAGRFPDFLDVFVPLRNVIVILLFVWFTGRLVYRLTDAMERRAKLRQYHFDQTAADAIAKLTIAVLVVFALLAIMNILGFSLASLLTFGGVA